MERGLTIVIGTGEIGAPLLEVLSSRYRTRGVDVEPVEITERVDVMHVCYPFQIGDFVGTTVEYIEKYSPSLVIINSTVAPGTTRKVAERAPGVKVAYSPVRGKHKKMKQDLLFYTKFVAGVEKEWGEEAASHFACAGVKVRLFSSPEALELAKLLSTTYFGLLIAWAQEMDRFAKNLNVDYDEITQFFEEIPYFPKTKFFPGFIGGHCVIPNIHILRMDFPSPFLDAILDSNERKKKELEGRE